MSIVDEPLAATHKKGVRIMADTSTRIKVKGRVELRPSTKCWFWHIIFTWYDDNVKDDKGKPKRQRESISTKFTESHADVAKKKTRNKGRAEKVCEEEVKKKEAEVNCVSGSSNLLVADFMEKIWLPEIKKEVSTRTYSGYKVNVKSSIAPYFRSKNIFLQRLTADDINTYLKDLKKGWYNPKVKKQIKGVKNITAYKRFANLSKALKYASEENFIPSAEVLLEKVKRPNIEIRSVDGEGKEAFLAKYFSEDEFVAVCHKARGSKLELPIYFGGAYGLRLSEVTGMRWRSINLKNSTLIVEHKVTTCKDDDGKQILVASDITKSKSSRRTLPLDPDFVEFLQKIKTEQEYNKKICGKNWNKEWDGYVCVDSTGELIKPNYITEAFPKFLVKHGFERIRFHDLRHTCAYLKITNGASLLDVQMWLGHSSYDITVKYYIHLTYEDKVASAQKMAPITQRIFQNNDDVIDTDDNENIN